MVAFRRTWNMTQWNWMLWKRPTVQPKYTLECQKSMSKMHATLNGVSCNASIQLDFPKWYSIFSYCLHFTCKSIVWVCMAERNKIKKSAKQNKRRRTLGNSGYYFSTSKRDSFCIVMLNLIWKDFEENEEKEVSKETKRMKRASS